MERRKLEQFKGKEIRISLKDGFFYTCKIIQLDDDSVEIKDKFDKVLVVNLDLVSKVQVV